MADTTRLRVDGGSPYDVVIGREVLGELNTMLGPGVQRVAVVHPEVLGKQTATVLERLDEYQLLDVPVPDSEAAKAAPVAARCWDRLGEAGFTRSDAVVTVGGGGTTDLGGFVAATWLRGVQVVHVPTTLLGMVDAAIGGKTGINTAAGKNLVGAFHEPGGVVCDLDLLETLPRAELASGLGEVIKCGFIADPEILGLVESDPEGALDPSSSVLRELVERAVAVKVEIVASDLKETGHSDGRVGREALNYGHTTGHVIERVTDYGIRHGEAVGLGMVFAAELARRAGRLDDETAARHARVLALVDLPMQWRGAPFEQLLATMRLDKKSRGDLLRFVVLDGLASPTILEGPDEALLRSAYDAMAGGLR
ncbi:MAG: 3-dehydroquinate synthase [Actinomycetota bacterium]|nr:3-dehydroquinate synthase [Actinomycetota bacterium]